MVYSIMKLLHVFFVILFLGNIIVAVFWKRHGDKSNNPAVIANTVKGLIKADKLFTMPGVIGLAIFGFAAQGIGGLSITSAWILYSIVFYVLSGAAFMAKVVPLQKKMLASAEASEFNPDEYQRLSKEWELWGSVATAAPIIAVVLMVLKPY